MFSGKNIDKKSEEAEAKGKKLYEYTAHFLFEAEEGLTNADVKGIVKNALNIKGRCRQIYVYWGD